MEALGDGLNGVDGLLERLGLKHERDNWICRVSQNLEHKRVSLTGHLDGGGKKGQARP